VRVADGETNATGVTLSGMGTGRSAFGLAVGVMASALILGGCASGHPAPRGTGEAAPGWRQVDDSPLSARTMPTLAWSGSEVFVIGGDVGPPCPPNADCAWTALARDGAAFDPLRGTWRLIPDAPVDVPPSSAAFAGGQLFISVTEATGESVLISYDVESDGWRTWDMPDAVPRTLVADGARLLLVSGTDEQDDFADLALDVASGQWSELPSDPLGPAFDRVFTATPAGPILTAKELVASPGSEGPALVVAALYDGASRTWTRLPDTGQIGGWRWMLAGDRLVDPQLGGADGGEVGNWGRTYPFGGTLTLPDGAWSPLPDPPEPLPNAWIHDAVGQGPFAVSGGYLYDGSRESWTILGEPQGAPHQPGPAIWADDVLLVIGGVDWTDPAGVVSTKTWTYTPTS
jgi:hypothetical protein